MTLKERAHAVGMEWIEEGGDVCFRPMLRDAEGRRVVREYPDPKDFRPAAEMVGHLEAVEATCNAAPPMAPSRRAANVAMEWIENPDGDVCLRPMRFDDAGIRVVRPEPLPEEFISRKEALERLELLERTY